MLYNFIVLFPLLQHPGLMLINTQSRRL